MMPFVYSTPGVTMALSEVQSTPSISFDVVIFRSSVKVVVLVAATSKYSRSALSGYSFQDCRRSSGHLKPDICHQSGCRLANLKSGHHPFASAQAEGTRIATARLWGERSSHSQPTYKHEFAGNGGRKNIASYLQSAGQPNT
jgi:hypothetical protein